MTTTLAAVNEFVAAAEKLIIALVTERDTAIAARVKYRDKLAKTIAAYAVDRQALIDRIAELESHVNT